MSLIGGRQLAEMMIDLASGVQATITTVFTLAPLPTERQRLDGTISADVACLLEVVMLGIAYSFSLRREDFLKY